nr:retrovirus-related Pol polyprotein from transposon TNT 1-94 [Tanacetum cinerariifolium]
SNTSQQNPMDDDEDEPGKPRMRSMQYLYDSTIEINYDEVFSPIARMETIETIRLLISQAAQLKWNIYQTGVKPTFSNGVLKEEAWNTRIGSYLKKNGYVQCLEIRQDNYGIFVLHETYAKEILKKFDMEECNPVATPMAPDTKFSKFKGGDQVDAGKYQSVVRSLRYLTCTRPVIAYSVGVVSQFMEDPSSYFSWLILLKIYLTEQPAEIRADNELAFKLVRNPIHHDRRKHKDACLYFIMDRIRNEEAQLTHVVTRDQIANIFTKALPTELFNDFKMMLGIKDGRDLSLKEKFVRINSSHK